MSDIDAETRIVGTIDELIIQLDRLREDYDVEPDLNQASLVLDQILETCALLDQALASKATT